MEVRVLLSLEALKRASKEIERDPESSGGPNSPSMKALLALENNSNHLFPIDPNLSTLSHLLSRLKSISLSLQSKNKFSSCSSSTSSWWNCCCCCSWLNRRIKSFLGKRSGVPEIALVASSISSELQSWIDRECIGRFIFVLNSDDEEKISALSALENRLNQGFNRNLQDILLRAGIFSAVESTLTNPSAPSSVRDRAVAAVLALVKFNRAVFAGPVLMGKTIPAMVESATPSTLHSLAGLIKSIRSPLVDELLAGGELIKITRLVSSETEGIREAAFDCIVAVGYFGRKEAIESMMDSGLIKRLILLERLKDGAAVARFGIAMEIGEGLAAREKRVMKIEIVKKVREAAASEAEAAAVMVEVLWGTNGW